MFNVGYACLALCAVTLPLSGCDEVERPGGRWSKSKFGVHDGAIRVGAENVKVNRELTVRCFGHTATVHRKLDIRYTILTSPSLEKMDKAFKSVDGLTLSVSIDDDPATLVTVQGGFSGGGLWFLGEIDRPVAERIRDAKNRIVTLPAADRREPLDVAVEFGVKDLGVHLTRVLEACPKD